MGKLTNGNLLDSAELHRGTCIGLDCLVTRFSCTSEFRIQNEAEVSIYGVVSKCSMFRFLLNHNKLLLNVNYGIKLVILYVRINLLLHHTHVLFTASCGVNYSR